VQLVIHGSPHDSLGPLFRREIPVPGMQIIGDHSLPLTAAFTGDPLPAAELSLSRYLLGLAVGDERYVGVPVYLIRGFRHRAFYCAREATYTGLADLRGQRVGVAGWFDTGNTWCRAMLVDARVGLEEVDWYSTVPRGPRDLLDPPTPEFVTKIDRDTTLVQELTQGRLDVILSSFPPREFLAADGPLRRVVSHYPAAERDYFDRTGIYPGFHILAVSRAVYAEHPQCLSLLFDAVVASRDAWFAKNRNFTDLAPWAQVSVEEVAVVFPKDWQHHGIATRENRAMLAAFSTAQHDQGFRTQPLTAESMFPEFVATRDAS
jgi:4,5-dihydroxyphthalate decarboxylase